MSIASEAVPTEVRRDSEGHTSIEEWIDSRLLLEGLNPELADALRNVSRTIVRLRSENSGTCFLTVVIRTQGVRHEQLEDALLCLAAQTDRDFEIVIMMHNIAPEDEHSLRDLVASYPAEFATKVSLHHVVGGGRVRPLTESLSFAHGSYIAFFDDDDLLMANWVEAFRIGADTSPGKILRANVAIQSNRAEKWGALNGQRTVSAATSEYETRFRLLDHLQRNHTPFMGIAIPREFFSLWGERFDEDLPVCEDWDVLLRSATLQGVQSISELTAIYRQWEDANTSYTEHDRPEWRAAELRVQNKLNEAPFFTTHGIVAEVVENYEQAQKIEAELWKNLSALSSSTSWKITEPVRRTVRFARRLMRRDKKSPNAISGTVETGTLPQQDTSSE